MLHIAWLNDIYPASILIKAILVCNLVHHNAGHTAYVITYPVRYKQFLHYWHMFDSNHQQSQHLNTT